MDHRTKISLQSTAEQMLYEERASHPPYTYQIPFENITGIYSHIPNDIVNRIIITNLPKNVDPHINDIIDYYASIDQLPQFKWFVGPLATPDNLIENLLTNDFIISSILDILVLDLSNWEITPPPGLTSEFKFEQVSPSIYHNLFIEATDHNDTIKQELKDYFNKINRNLDRRCYFIKKGNKPVASSEMIVFDDQDIVYLSGAYTKIGYRRKGLYTHSVYRRLNKMKKENQKFVVVIADMETSSPILKPFNFEQIGQYQVCTYDLFEYRQTRDT